MKKFIVRLNIEYSLAVVAKDAQEAMERASKINLEDWEEARSEIEAELE